MRKASLCGRQRQRLLLSVSLIGRPGPPSLFVGRLSPTPICRTGSPRAARTRGREGIIDPPLVEFVNVPFKCRDHPDGYDRPELALPLASISTAEFFAS